LSTGKDSRTLVLHTHTFQVRVQSGFHAVKVPNQASYRKSNGELVAGSECKCAPVEMHDTQEARWRFEWPSVKSVTIVTPTEAHLSQPQIMVGDQTIPINKDVVPPVSVGGNVYSLDFGTDKSTAAWGFTGGNSTVEKQQIDTDVECGSLTSNAKATAKRMADQARSGDSSKAFVNADDVYLAIDLDKDGNITDNEKFLILKGGSAEGNVRDGGTLAVPFSRDPFDSEWWLPVIGYNGDLSFARDVKPRDRDNPQYFDDGMDTSPVFAFGKLASLLQWQDRKIADTLGSVKIGYGLKGSMQSVSRSYRSMAIIPTYNLLNFGVDGAADFEMYWSKDGGRTYDRFWSSAIPGNLSVASGSTR